MNPSEDDELEAIRQKRLQQLMSQQQTASEGGVNAAQLQQQEEAKREAAERRQALLVQVLEPEAKDRLSRISLVKAEKARRIEDMILAQATSGRLAGKISEEMLIGILEEVKERSGSSAKVTFSRRNILDED